MVKCSIHHLLIQRISTHLKILTLILCIKEERKKRTEVNLIEHHCFSFYDKEIKLELRQIELDHDSRTTGIATIACPAVTVKFDCLCAAGNIFTFSLLRKFGN